MRTAEAGRAATPSKAVAGPLRLIAAATILQLSAPFMPAWAVAARHETRKSAAMKAGSARPHCRLEEAEGVT